MIYFKLLDDDTWIEINLKSWLFGILYEPYHKVISFGPISVTRIKLR